jgi:phosphonate transport system ATP-binding protein
MTSQVSIRNLNKIYPGGHQALKNIDLDVKAGEFLAVVGLSGSGKTTLLRCMNRLTDSSSGAIRFEKKRVDLLKGKEISELRKEIGMIFQQFNLLPRQTVMKNVLMGRLGSTPTLQSLLGQFSKQDKDKASDYLSLVGLADKTDVRADRLSGGQQQRVAIARALMQNPKILLADEPVASLDPSTSAIIMNYLRRINQELGLTVVCSLHFLNLVREYASRVIALKDGKIVYEGIAKDIDHKWFQEIYGEQAKELHGR